jgi:hypothetical protein
MVGEAGDLSASRDSTSSPVPVSRPGFLLFVDSIYCRQRRDSLSAMGYCGYCFGVGFPPMDFLSAITPQLLVLGLIALILLVVTFVFVSLTLRS